jgi:hypothetical protein
MNYYETRFKGLMTNTAIGFGIGLAISILLTILMHGTVSSVLGFLLLFGPIVSMIICSKNHVEGFMNSAVLHFFSGIKGLFFGSIFSGGGLLLVFGMVKLIIGCIIMIPVCIYMAIAYILNLIYFTVMFILEKNGKLDDKQSLCDALDRVVPIAAIVLTLLFSIWLFGLLSGDGSKKNANNIKETTKAEPVEVVTEVEKVENTKEPVVEEEATKATEIEAADKEETTESEEQTDETPHASEYSCAIDSLKDNGDGTYTLIGSYVYETVPSDMTEEEYNALSLGCEFPVDSYYKEEGFHCVEATEEGFFFVESYYESLDEVQSEDTTLKVVKDGDKIKIYWQCLNSAYGEEWRFAEDFDKYVGDSKEFIITQDTTITLMSGFGSERNGYVPNYEDPVAIRDIGMDNVYGYYYNAEFMDDSYPGWHGIESVTVTTDDDGKVIDIREHMQAG